ncbi:MAG: hypothetical protein WA784_05025 [Albidovulum sp.]
MIDVALKLPEPTLAALQQIAATRDVSVGQVLRDFIDHELRRLAEAKTPVRADERLVAPLRALLADDFAYAKGWDDLQSRLALKGYALREAGGGLALYDKTKNARLCKGSELGYGYASLMRKFGSPFPGHSHRWLFDRVRDAAPQRY